MTTHFVLVVTLSKPKLPLKFQQTKKQMTITPRYQKPNRRSRPEMQKKSYPKKPFKPSPSINQETISKDLVIALEVTARLNKSFDKLITEKGCCEFLACHRLLGERITSNRNILLMLIGHTMDISIKAEKPELKTEHPDYFTK